jgi:CHASE3 domain sensor protein
MEGSSMDAIVETTVDYQKFFEETVLQLFECNGKLATANEQLAETRENLEQIQSEFDEYRANMEIIVIGGGVVIITLVLVIVFMAARQGNRSA